MHANYPRAMRRVASTMLVLCAAACGGGGGTPGEAGSGIVVADSPPPAAPAAPAAAQLSGAIVKGPVDGATVCAYELAASGKGPLIACTTTRPDGTYTLDLAYEGAVYVEATGGTYTDEASGTPGVALAAPLAAVASVGAGTQTVVVTPLTAMALQQALGGGPLTVAGFDAAAGQLATAFGLPAGVDLARNVPTVSGAVDAYGSVLVGVSRMLGRGATLPGIIHNTNLDALKAGYQQAGTTTCVPGTGLPSPSPAPPVQSSPPPEPGASGTIRLSGQAIDGGGMRFRAIRPFAAWRALLPASGAVMGCEVQENTPDLVRLACPAGALQSVTLDADPSGSSGALPSSGVLVAADAIEAEGHPPSGSTTVVMAPVGAYSGTVAGGSQSTAATGSGMVCTASAAVLDTSGAVSLGGTVGTGGTGGATGGTGGTVGAGGGVITIGGGGFTGAGTGSISVGGGTLSVSGGASQGGSLLLSGSSR